MTVKEQIAEPRRTRTVEEAAQVLGISRTSAYNAVKSGELPTRRVGGRVLVPVAALERLLADPGDANPAA